MKRTTPAPLPGSAGRSTRPADYRRGRDQGSLSHRLVHAVSVGLCLTAFLLTLRARLRWVVLGTYYEVVYVAS